MTGVQIQKQGRGRRRGLNVAHHLMRLSSFRYIFDGPAEQVSNCLCRFLSRLTAVLANHSNTDNMSYAKFTTTYHNDTYPTIQTSKHAGHVVLITGASRGIGRATAVSFARAGAAGIVIAARGGLDGTEAEMLAAAAEQQHVPVILKLSVDVTDEASVANAAHQTEQHFGRLDILINNAGYLENWHNIVESDPTDWWRSWTINIRGPYLMTRAFLPLLLKSSNNSNGLKTIVNVSSIGAHICRPGASAYQTNKFALLRFTEFIVSEYASQGVLAFAVHPGGVPTELALGMPKAIHQMLQDTPQLGADAITWWTQERQEWLAGRYVSVNWDVTEMMARKEEIVSEDKLKMRMAF